MAKRGHGEGTIYFHEKLKRWCTQVSVGYGESTRTPGKFTRKRKTIYGETRKEVAEKLKVILREQQQGLVAPTRGKLTVAQQLDTWLAYVKPTVRPRTYESYEMLVRVHIKPVLGHLQLAKLTSNHIVALLEKEEAEGKSPRTRAYLRSILRQALDPAVEDGIIPRNVALKTPKPRVERHEITVLTEAEAAQLLEAAAGDRLEALYSVALAIGLRQGEALGLRWDDIDLDAGELRVRTSLQRIDHKLELVRPKTDKSRRTLSLPASIVLVLRQHHLRQLEERMAAPVWHEQDLVFCTPKGTPLERSNINKRFAKMLEKAGLPKMRFHDLRHSCASLLLAQGVPLKVVQELLGHSSITITGDVYAHVMPAAKREAANIMDSIVSKRKT